MMKFRINSTNCLLAVALVLSSVTTRAQGFEKLIESIKPLTSSYSFSIYNSEINAQLLEHLSTALRRADKEAFLDELVKQTHPSQVANLFQLDSGFVRKQLELYYSKRIYTPEFSDLNPLELVSKYPFRAVNLGRHFYLIQDPKLAEVVQNSSIALLDLSKTIYLQDETLPHWVRDSFKVEGGPYDGALALVRALAKNDHLVSLSFSHAKIGDAVVIELAHSLQTNSTLRVLDLIGCQITHAGAEALAGTLKVNTTLRELRIGSNDIGEQSENLLKAAKNPELKLSF